MYMCGFVLSTTQSVELTADVFTTRFIKYLVPVTALLAGWCCAAAAAAAAAVVCLEVRVVRGYWSYSWVYTKHRDGP